MSFDDSDERMIGLFLRFNVNKLANDLTLLLLLLNSGREKPLEPLSSYTELSYEALNSLKKEGYIVGSRKTVTLTQEGLNRAIRLEAEFLNAMEGRYKKEGSKEEIKARDSVSFYCDICKADVKPPLWYEPYRGYLDGKVTREYAIEHLKRYHMKHWHTDENEISRRRFLYNMNRGMGIMEAGKEAREYAKRMVV